MKRSRRRKMISQWINITKSQYAVTDPELCRMDGARLAEIQARMAKKLEEMAWEAITGGIPTDTAIVPERERIGPNPYKIPLTFPSGNCPKSVYINGTARPSWESV